MKLKTSKSPAIVLGIIVIQALRGTYPSKIQSFSVVVKSSDSCYIHAVVTSCWYYAHTRMLYISAQQDNNKIQKNRSLYNLRTNAKNRTSLVRVLAPQSKLSSQ